MSRQGRKAESRSILPSKWWLLAAIVAIGTVAYCNSFRAPMVFDDLLSIQKNTRVRFGEFSSNPFQGRWLLYVTFTSNYLWSGQDVWTYHVVNLLLHVVNGSLLFFVGLRIFEHVEGVGRRQCLWAFLASSFFLVHPVQTESVTYISQRAELLSATFFITGFLI